VQHNRSRLPIRPRPPVRSRVRREMDAERSYHAAEPQPARRWEPRAPRGRDESQPFKRRHAENRVIAKRRSYPLPSVHELRLDQRVNLIKKTEVIMMSHWNIVLGSRSASAGDGPRHCAGRAEASAEHADQNIVWPVTGLYFPLIGIWFYRSMGRPMAVERRKGRGP